MENEHINKFRFDVDDLIKDEIVVSKIEAARRQLVTAVKMFFYNCDVVSQHTLVGAAHGILYDLAKKQEKKLSIKDSPLISEGQRDNFIRAINFPQNYFKHANRDPKKKMVFRYHGTAFYLLDAILMYRLLSGEATYEMRVFLMWVQLRFPDLLCLKSAEVDLSKIRNDTDDPDIFKLLGKVLLAEQEKNEKAQ